MSTIRIAQRRRFTSIAKEALNDQRLSFRARGVLAWLLDKPDNWRIDSEAIAKASGALEPKGGPREGRDAIRTALNELVTTGYLVREKVRDPRTGQISQVCTLYESPQNVVSPPLSTGDGSTGAGSTGAGQGGPGPETAQPAPVQAAPLKRLRTEEEDLSTSSRSSTQNQPTPTPSSSRPPEWEEWEQVFAGCGITPLSEKVWEEGYRLLGAIPSLTVISLRSVIERAKVVWPTGASANITPRSIAQNWENLNRPVDKGKGGGARSVLQTWEDRRSAFPWSDYSFEHLVTDPGERARALRQSGYRSEEEMLAHRADSRPWPIGSDGYVIVPEGALS